MTQPSAVQSISYSVEITSDHRLVVNDNEVPAPDGIQVGDSETLLEWALDQVALMHQSSGSKLHLTIRDLRDSGYGTRRVQLDENQNVAIEDLRAHTRHDYRQATLGMNGQHSATPPQSAVGEAAAPPPPPAPVEESVEVPASAVVEQPVPAPPAAPEPYHTGYPADPPQPHAQAHEHYPQEEVYQGDHYDEPVHPEASVVAPPLSPEDEAALYASPGGGYAQDYSHDQSGYYQQPGADQGQVYATQPEVGLDALFDSGSVSARTAEKPKKDWLPKAKRTKDDGDPDRGVDAPVEQKARHSSWVPFQRRVPRPVHSAAVESETGEVEEPKKSHWKTVAIVAGVLVVLFVALRVFMGGATNYVAVCVDTRTMARLTTDQNCADGGSAYYRWWYTPEGSKVPAVKATVDQSQGALVKPNDKATVDYGFAADGGLVGEANE